MIDQAKDKKDDVLKEKLAKGKAEPQKEDPAKALLQQAKAEQEKAVEKAPDKDAQSTDKAASNGAQAIQPLGSARVTSEQAEVHAEPGKAGAKIGTLKAESKVEVLGRKDDELKVMVDGKIGYIASDKTDFEGKSAAAKAPKAIGTAQITCAALNVRQAPGTDQAAMGVLQQGDRVKFYGEKSGFLEIRVGDSVGYIAAEFTDYAGQQKAVPKNNEKSEQALSNAPEALQELLAKETLTTAEIAQARTMIEQAQESLRGDLYEALQTKPSYMRAQKESKTKPQNATGAGLENLASCLQLLGIQNPSSDMPYESYLEQIKRDQKLPAQSNMENWGAIANAMGASYRSLCRPGDRTGLEKAFWSEIVREQLRQGHAVMACVQHQAVRIEAIDEKGLVVTVPDDSQGFTGLGAGWAAYEGKTNQKANGKRGLLDFNALGQASLQWVIAMS
ncbi:MAG: SH3 domain-containing protein [Proteobacteria bacterium]|nr:SH3 domain-containing protein [Pseudomonadota bacterium]